MSDSRRLPTPEPGNEASWVEEHLRDLWAHETSPAGSAVRFRGGQSAADTALAAFDVEGYARKRNEVWPPSRQGASKLSPYIRHGLISLPEAHAAVAGGPHADVESFRSELLWQEFARHLYARLGSATAQSLRFSVSAGSGSKDARWDRQMACVDLSVSDLQQRGWLTNQQRMWLASQHAVREAGGWREGEDVFFSYLLDGSRAANRVGWQWTVGALTGKPYGFSRWQVDKRAPGLCQRCPLVDACPIEDWPPEDPPEPRADVDPRMRRDDDLSRTAGPLEEPDTTGIAVDRVWLTAESLGDADPALRAWPDVPVVFVFDAPLLSRLRLAAHRLVFLAECLADLSTRRAVEVWRGDPVEVLGGAALAATFAPVPGWRARAARLEVSAVHPWPWLVRPHAGPVTSFTAWRRRAGA